LTNPPPWRERIGRFDLVIPSMRLRFPAATATGWDPVRIASAGIVLMKRLGYANLWRKGGDWGMPSRSRMVCSTSGIARQHTSMRRLSQRRFKGAPVGGPPPSGLSPTNNTRTTSWTFLQARLAYALEMANRPQTL